MLSKIVKITCIVGISAFLFHAILAPFYKPVEGNPFIISMYCIGLAFLLFSFQRRQRWSWSYVLMFTLAHTLMSIFLPPTEYFYERLVSIVQILVFIEALACAVIFVTMLLPATKVWFTDSALLENINKDQFHKGEVFEVSYQNSFWDIVWFNFYQTPRSRTAQISLVLSLLAIAFLVFSALSDSEFSLGIKIIVYLFAVLAIFFGVSMFIFGIFSFIYLVRQFDIRATQDCRLSISESGIIAETPFRNSAIKWSAITKIQQNARYIMFYLTDTAAVLIPKRCLADNTDSQHLLSYSQQCLENSRNGNHHGSI